MPTVFDSSSATEFVALLPSNVQVVVADTDAASDYVNPSTLRMIREIVNTGNVVYEARIRAFNRGGLYSPWSDIVSSSPS